MTSVLLVEDEEAIRRVILLTLQQLGYEVVAARHGREGLERCGTRVFDLVVTDLDMPEMSGLDLISTLLDLGQVRRFLIITAKPDRVPPGWPCLAKPFRLRQLLEKVDSLLS